MMFGSSVADQKSDVKENACLFKDSGGFYIDFRLGSPGFYILIFLFVFQCAVAVVAVLVSSIDATKKGK